MKIMTIIGARPQFVKAAMLSRAISEAGEGIEEISIHTGQHYDHAMSGVFFDELSMPEPAENLGISGGTHGEMTGLMLPALEGVMVRYEPTVVVVIGDTNSTMAGALAAAKLCIPIAHVEAGMRHYKRDIPEEINRVVTDHLSDLLFCSSDHSREALAREGITRGVSVPGDISYDLFKMSDKHRSDDATPDGPFVLCTIHRAANTDCPKRLESIMRGIAACPFPVFLPMHPRTAKAMERFGLDLPANVLANEPVSYHTMLGLLAACEYVITDSGGLQKEAFFAKKRCITLSEVSPWQELLDLDVDRLVGANTDDLVGAYPWAASPIETSAQPYGRGDAATRMVSGIVEAFSDSPEPVGLA